MANKVLIEIYVDASFDQFRQDGSLGIVTTFMEDDRVVVSGKAYSIPTHISKKGTFACEFYGVFCAINHFIEIDIQHPDKFKAMIYCDNEPVVQSFIPETRNKVTEQEPLNRFYNDILELNKLYDFYISWIKRDSNIFHQLADRIANYQRNNS